MGTPIVCSGADVKVVLASTGHEANVGVGGLGLHRVAATTTQLQVEATRRTLCKWMILVASDRTARDSERALRQAR